MAESSEESMTKQADIDNLMEHISRNTYSAKGDVTVSNNESLQSVEKGGWCSVKIIQKS